MVTDPIADLLVRLQNASAVGKPQVRMPFSSMRLALAELLAREGYVAGAQKSSAGSLEVTLRYGDDGRPAIAGSRRISRLSRRVYCGSRDIRPVKNGHGLLVLSTPKGVLSGRDARAAHVGGEALFEIW